MDGDVTTLTRGIASTDYAARHRMVHLTAQRIHEEAAAIHDRAAAFFRLHGKNDLADQQRQLAEAERGRATSEKLAAGDPPFKTRS